MSSTRKLPDGRWQATFRPVPGAKRVTRTAKTKSEVKRWLDSQTVAFATTGTVIDRRNARMTVGEWSDEWLRGYSKAPATVRQAKVHIAKVKATFGDVPLSAVRPSMVRNWTKRLRDEEDLADSYVYALHSRLSQLFTDAIADGIIVTSNPCSKRTAPPAAKQRPYVATHEQVQALLGVFPAHLRPAVLLGAFCGLRVGEACGLRVTDVDWMRGVVLPTVQYPEQPILKSSKSHTPVPIPTELVVALSASVARHGSRWVVSNGTAGQASTWAVERAIRSARKKIVGVPDDFRHHDLRHYFASFLIASGADVKVVQERLRHESAKVTLDVYGHLWPDRDESTRAAVAEAMCSVGLATSAAS